MAARIPQHVREEQIRSLCEGTIYSFVRWEGEYRGVRSKFIYTCEEHGERIGKVEHFLNGTRCLKCGVAKRVFTKEERELQFKEEFENSTYRFVKWSNFNGGNTSRAVFGCEKHGEWETRVSCFVAGHRCPECGVESAKKLQRFDSEMRTKEITLLCEENGYTFKGWCDGYQNARSLFRCECQVHGEWNVGFSAFKHGTRCPACAKTGFDPVKPAWLYCLVSKENSLIKVGITNNLETRVSQLRHYTPFDFEVVETIRKEDGYVIQKLEKLFHREFLSANLKGFQGCTEWLKWNHEIPLWFRLLNG